MLGPAQIIEATSLSPTRSSISRGVGRHLGVLSQHHDRDHPTVLRDVGAQSLPNLLLVTGAPQVAHPDSFLHRGRHLAAIPLLKYTGAGCGVAATAMIYLSYFLGTCGVSGRLKGWRRRRRRVVLGKWGC